MTPAKPDDAPRKVSRATIVRVIACFRPHVAKVALVGLSLLFTSSVGLLNPLLVRAMIDHAIPSHDLGLLVRLAGAMVAVTIFGGALDTGETYLATLVGQRVMLELRGRLYRHLQRMSLRFFTDTRAGEILSRVTSDVNGVQELVTTTAAEILSNSIVVLTTLALMFALDWKLTLVCLGMLPFFVYPTRKAGSVRRRISKEVQAKVADLSTVLEETMSVSGVLLTKTFGRQAREIARFAGTSEELTRLEIRRTMIAQIFWLTLQTFWAAAPALIYWWGGRSVAAGTMTLGSVVAFITLQNRLFFPLGRLFGVQVQIQGTLAVFDRIFEYLDLPVEIGDVPSARRLEVARGEIAVEDVSFAYATQPVLKDVSFVAQPGTLTALVGPSGAGKTTLTYLIPRLYDVGAGAIRIDGHDVRQVTLESLGRSIGVVTQETYLFHTSVRENLRYGRPEATDEEIAEAARAAQIHDRILELPDGYETLVGERGYKLSGGERQRLAIARVILKAAPIVILDEATSALDTVSERLIQAALEPLTRGRTTIAIAHRLSTVLKADQILVVEKGRIVERGSHAELYAARGLYARLFDEQFAVYTDAPAAPARENAS
jgi:ATP-binding cassette subfamily B protein